MMPRGPDQVKLINQIINEINLIWILEELNNTLQKWKEGKHEWKSFKWILKE